MSRTSHQKRAAALRDQIERAFGFSDARISDNENAQTVDDREHTMNGSHRRQSIFKIRRKFAGEMRRGQRRTKNGDFASIGLFKNFRRRFMTMGNNHTRQFGRAKDGA